MQLKQCTTCNIEKSISEFSKHQKGKFGVRSVCKICTSIESKEYKNKPRH